MSPRTERREQLRKRAEEKLKDPNLSAAKRAAAQRVKDGMDLMLARSSDRANSSEPPNEEDPPRPHGVRIPDGLYDEAEQLARAHGAPDYMDPDRAIPIAFLLAVVGESVATLFFKGAGGAGTVTALVVGASYYLHAKEQNRRRFRMQQQALEYLMAKRGDEA